MQILVVIRVLGLLLMLFSFSMLPPAAIGWFYADGAALVFVHSFVLIFLAGLAMFIPVYNQNKELRLRDGFMVVVMFWGVLGITGGLPLYLAEELTISVTDAIFESMSGLTTTGATVIVGLDSLPHAILFYRQQLQWLGGMGIIVLAVAILPMLGIGGMQLYRAETPGPVKDNKLSPRITETAKQLWFIYLGLTVLCALFYWAAGMGGFDAIAHAFSTVAIGGFSTHDASIGYFNNPLIEYVAILFMLISGVNFSLHFIALRSRHPLGYWRDAEFRAYITILTILAIVTVAYLWLTQIFDNPWESFRTGLFHVVSIGTTTGFTTAEYYLWPGFLPVMLLFASYIGGCAGSTAGGIKVIRVLLLMKQGARELKRLVHPNAQISVKIGRKPLSEKVIAAVWGFFAAYFTLSGLMILLLMASGLNQDTAFSAVAACMNNLGPGLDGVAQNFAGINDFSKGVLSLAMLLGRLEIFTLLVLFTPAFWKK